MGDLWEGNDCLRNGGGRGVELVGLILARVSAYLAVWFGSRQWGAKSEEQRMKTEPCFSAVI